MYNRRSFVYDEKVSLRFMCEREINRLFLLRLIG